MKPPRPSMLTVQIVLAYALAAMVPFYLSNKSFAVFLFACAGGIPLAVWRAIADQRDWNRGKRW